MRVHRQSRLVIVLGFASLARAAAPVPASAPAALDEWTSVITYAVPGSTAGATSNATVVVPRAYGRPASARTRFPVIYLLHGYAASYARYNEQFRLAGRPLVEFADRFGTILVMPDGKCCSWFLDASPEMPDAPDWQYETIMVGHVIPEIDRRYRTWAAAAGRGISGISMGGHGAIYLAARHPDLFAAASSMSGIMNLLDCTHPEELAKRIGRLEEQRARWLEHSVLGQADKLAGRNLGLLFDCGWDDPFLWNNRMLHDKLMRLNVAHDYIERPGRHDWAYWLNALPYHLQFLADRLKPAGQ
jgi:S-formylglutathione hydrolase FrmB